MSVEYNFFIYCIEIYKCAKNLTGRQTYELFERSGADRYIIENAEALHTTGEKYIINDIDGFIADAERSAV